MQNIDLEFDIAIPLDKQIYGYPALLIEYSPTYWHIGKEKIDQFKYDTCKELGIRLINIVEDSYNNLDTQYSYDYICDRIDRLIIKDRQEKLKNMVAFILSTLNIESSNIDFNKAHRLAIGIN